MKTKKSIFSAGLLVLFIACFVLLITVDKSWTQTAKGNILTSDDCIKCHAVPPADIAKAGGGHKVISCQDCHAGHRPLSKDNIPQCNQCHMGKSHYELKGCLTCHKNPHTPLAIMFTGQLTEPCLTCHKGQIEQLKTHKSKHTALTCTNCHDVHRKLPECLKCHKPHSADMANADCKGCHKAHMPAVVTYASDIASKNCAACHKTAYDLLTANKTKHKNFACAFCHQEKHKMVPKCQDCHSTPHPEGITARFPKCNDCHNTAHDLNQWTVIDKKDASKDIKKKK